MLHVHAFSRVEVLNVPGLLAAPELTNHPRCDVGAHEDWVRMTMPLLSHLPCIIATLFYGTRALQIILVTEFLNLVFGEVGASVMPMGLVTLEHFVSQDRPWNIDSCILYTAVFAYTIQSHKLHLHLPA